MIRVILYVSDKLLSFINFLQNLSSLGHVLNRNLMIYLILIK
jgi:hypothetical protein